MSDAVKLLKTIQYAIQQRYLSEIDGDILDVRPLSKMRLTQKRQNSAPKHQTIRRIVS